MYVEFYTVIAPEILLAFSSFLLNYYSLWILLHTIEVWYASSVFTKPLLLPSSLTLTHSLTLLWFSRRLFTYQESRFLPTIHLTFPCFLLPSFPLLNFSSFTPPRLILAPPPPPPLFPSFPSPSQFTHTHTHTQTDTHTLFHSSPHLWHPPHVLSSLSSPPAQILSQDFTFILTPSFFFPRSQYYSQALNFVVIYSAVVSRLIFCSASPIPHPYTFSLCFSMTLFFIHILTSSPLPHLLLHSPHS